MYLYTLWKSVYVVKRGEVFIPILRFFINISLHYRYFNMLIKPIITIQSYFSLRRKLR